MNDAVIERFQRSRPHLVGVARAGDTVPSWPDQMVLHAGPPIEPSELPPTVAGAVVGGLVFEGIDRRTAEELVRTGEVDLRSCHDLGFVGPLAGVVTANMPVWIVEDYEYGNRAFATFNEGLGKVLRYGANDDAVIRHLQWMRDTLSPTLGDALTQHDPIDLKAFLAEGLRRGDELHNRNKASTASFVRELAPSIARAGGRGSAEVFEFLRGNDHFFLNISMASSKCSADAARAAGTGTIVTAMCSNGRGFGIQVSGLGSRWITAPANFAIGTYFEGFSKDDASPDLGDSFISEVVGLGGFAMAAAPAIARFVGGTPSQFAAWTLRMYSITASEHEQFLIPSLDFRGAPLGIDVRLVVQSSVLPVMNTGIAHGRPGVGQIGAGLTHPPMACFAQADELLRSNAIGRGEG